MNLSAELTGLDFFRFRRLLWLVDGLPAEAAIWREEARWTADNELAAAQVEAIDNLTRVVIRLVGQTPRGEPLRIDRPGQRAQSDEESAPSGRRRQASGPEIAQFFGKHFGKTA